MAKGNRLQQAAVRWANAMRSAQTKQNYVDGINAVTESPMEKAASDQAQQLFLQRVTDSVTSGRRAAKLRAVPLQFWKSQATGVGATNLTTAAQKGLQKVTDNFAKNQGVYMAASTDAAAIPKDGTTATALRKVEASINALKRGFGKPV